MHGECVSILNVNNIPYHVETLLFYNHTYSVPNWFEVSVMYVFFLYLCAMIILLVMNFNNNR